MRTEKIGARAEAATSDSSVSEANNTSAGNVIAPDAGDYGRLGGVVSEINATLFPDVSANSKREVTLSQRGIVEALLGDGYVAKAKPKLPLIKLQRFTGKKSAKGSLRHDEGVSTITGVEGDYDAEEMPVDEAVRLLDEAGIQCVVYTSPSHTPETPRWRVLAPLSQPYVGNTDKLREKRKGFLRRIDAALGWVLASESYTLSQAFFFGRVVGVPFEVHEVQGRYVDLLPDVQRPEGQRPRLAAKQDWKPLPERRGEWLHRMLSSKDLHTAAAPMISSMVAKGNGAEEIRFMFEGMRDSLVGARGHERVDAFYGRELDALITSGIEKFGVLDEDDEIDQWEPPEVGAVEIPDSILNPPFERFRGLLDWLNISAPKTNPVISLFGGIGILATAAGRRYETKGWHNHTTIYLGIIAGTGMAKDYVRRAAEEVFGELHHHLNGGPGFASGPAVFAALENKPCGLTVIDEFGDYITEALSGKASHKAGVFPELRKVYSITGQYRPNVYSAGTLTPKQRDTLAARTVYAPNLVLLGLSTPKQFYESVGEKFAEDGTLNRFIWANASLVPSRFPKAREMQRQPPDWLSRHVDDVRRYRLPAITGLLEPEEEGNLSELSISLDDRADMQPHLLRIPFSTEAQLFIAKIGDVEQEGTILHREVRGAPLLVGLAVRWRENAMRLALAVTAWEGEAEISRETLEWCFEFVMFWGKRFVAQFSELADLNQVAKDRQALLDQIRACGRDGITACQLGRSGHGRKFKSRDRKEMVAELLELGLIVQQEARRGCKPTRIYRAVRG